MTKNKTAPNVRSAKDFVPRSAGRKSPADRMIEEQGDGYYTIRHSSEVCGLHVETLRRLLRTNKVDAPSNVMIRGGMHIWLLTDEDLIEVANYFGVQNRVIKELNDKFNNKIPTKLLKLIGDEE